MRIIWELSSESYQWELSSENYQWELSSENYDLVYNITRRKVEIYRDTGVSKNNNITFLLVFEIKVAPAAAPSNSKLYKLPLYPYHLVYPDYTLE